jgi:hypothetical protein
MSSITSSYYTPDPDRLQYTYPLANHLGFFIDIPHKPPVATPWYFGENALPGRRELVMRGDPEYFAVDNIIPHLTESIPLVNMNDPSYQFRRAKYTFYI